MLACSFYYSFERFCLHDCAQAVGISHVSQPPYRLDLLLRELGSLVHVDEGAQSLDPIAALRNLWHCLRSGRRRRLVGDTARRLLWCRRLLRVQRSIRARYDGFLPERLNFIRIRFFQLIYVVETLILCLPVELLSVLVEDFVRLMAGEYPHVEDLCPSPLMIGVPECCSCAPYTSLEKGRRSGIHGDGGGAYVRSRGTIT